MSHRDRLPCSSPIEYASPKGFRGHASAFLRVESDRYGLKAPGSRAERQSPGLLSSRGRGISVRPQCDCRRRALPSVAVLANFPNGKLRNGNERAAPRDTVRQQQVPGREGHGVRSSSGVVRRRDHHARTCRRRSFNESALHLGARAENSRRLVRASSLRACGQVRATVSQTCSSTPATTSSSPSTLTSF
jgi:hypothetical protein